LDAEQSVYTLRYHRLDGAPAVDPDELVRQTAHLLDRQSRVVFYDPLIPKCYAPSHQPAGDLDLGRPDACEAEDIRRIQQVVWNNPPEVLYPVDIHSVEFALATSLVARAEGQTAGFLFGMTRFGGAALPDLWREKLRHRMGLESQTMGVLSAFRGRHIAFWLKKIQAEQAQRRGIDIINWTADPLQFPNAALNFTRLGAVAWVFHPAFYAFRNQLNRVTASRFRLTWLVGSERVRAILAGTQPTAVVDLAGRRQIVRVNDGPGAACFDADSPTIAFEIPAHWTALQENDLPLARRWRETTDNLFAHYLGMTTGRYMITGAALDGGRRFLLGERVDDEFLARLISARGHSSKADFLERRCPAMD